MPIHVLLWNFMSGGMMVLTPVQTIEVPPVFVPLDRILTVIGMPLLLLGMVLRLVRADFSFSRTPPVRKGVSRRFERVLR